MKGHHSESCRADHPDCLCNTCANDNYDPESDAPATNDCCIGKYGFNCAIRVCPDYMREDDDADA